MKNKLRLFGIYLPIFLAAIIATVAMRTTALFTSFDLVTGYYSGSILITVADYILVGVSLFMFTYIFTARKDIKLIPDFTTPATYIPTGLVTVTLAFMAVSLVRRALKVLKYIRNLQRLNTPSAVAAIPTQRILLILLIASAVFAMLGISHFVLNAVVESHASTKRANLGLCTIIFLALYSVYLYFNSELPLNSPNKVLDQMVYLFVCVFFLYETRLSLGRERWRSYISFGFISALIAAYSSIPSAIFYFATGEIVSNSIYEIALSFTLFIFITSRILLTANLIEDKPSDTVLALASASDARELEINPPKKIPDVIDIVGESLSADGDKNQITIDEMQAEIAETEPAEEDTAEAAPDEKIPE